MLRRAFSAWPDVEIFDPNGEGLKLVHRYTFYRRAHRILWGLWRRLPGSKLSWTLPAVFLAALADWLFARWIPSCTIYHCCTGVCLFSMKKAKRLGAITMIENATMHARDWQKAVIEECNTFGVLPRNCRATLPRLLIQRLEREYERCDYIIVPSTIAGRVLQPQGSVKRQSRSSPASTTSFLARRLWLNRGPSSEFATWAESNLPRVYRTCCRHGSSLISQMRSWYWPAR